VSAKPAYFHDAHCHAPGEASGGLVIALEGNPVFPGTVPNSEVGQFHDPARALIAVPYVRAGCEVEGRAIKYHPRRERYDPNWVSADITRFARRLVLIDSLNAVHWPPRAYLDLAKAHSEVEFVMCHAGGYDIVEFVKMCRFLPNVWLDFSVTQHEFGWVTGQRSPAYIGDVIDHALHERRTAPRILFGSDFPLLQQADALERLIGSVAAPEPFLTGNFERLLDVSGAA
jgi:predicted TIM-barrel fold metal-dependent hydrolase